MKINGKSSQPSEHASAAQQPKAQGRGKQQSAQSPGQKEGDRVDLSEKGAKLQAHDRDLAESRKLLDMIQSGKLSAADEAFAMKRVDEIHRRHEQ